MKRRPPRSTVFPYTAVYRSGLQGLFVNTEAVTPVGRTEVILKVTGAVVAPTARVAVAVSTPPAAPRVMVNVDGVAARLKSKAAPTETVIAWLAVPVAPRLSVTVSVAVKTVF